MHEPCRGPIDNGRHRRIEDFGAGNTNSPAMDRLTYFAFPPRARGSRPPCFIANFKASILKIFDGGSGVPTQDIGERRAVAFRREANEVEIGAMNRSVVAKVAVHNPDKRWTICVAESAAAGSGWLRGIRLAKAGGRSKFCAWNN